MTLTVKNDSLGIRLLLHVGVKPSEHARSQSDDKEMNDTGVYTDGVRGYYNLRVFYFKTTEDLKAGFTDEAYKKYIEPQIMSEVATS